MNVDPTERLNVDMYIDTMLANAGASLPYPPERDKEAKEEARCNVQYDSDWAALVENAKFRQQIHNTHMSIFVSVMRIRFAWIVFFLVVFLLVSDLVLVYASAMKAICIWELYTLCGAGCGTVVGWLHHNLSSAALLHQDLMKTSPEESHDLILQRVWCHNHGLGKHLLRFGLGGMAAGLVMSIVFHDCRHVIELEESVIIALITSTTASVVGILAIVMKWLFPTDFSAKGGTGKVEKPNG